MQTIPLLGYIQITIYVSEIMFYINLIAMKIPDLIYCV